MILESRMQTGRQLRLPDWMWATADTGSVAERCKASPHAAGYVSC